MKNYKIEKIQEIFLHNCKKNIFIFVKEKFELHVILIITAAPDASVLTERELAERGIS